MKQFDQPQKLIKSSSVRTRFTPTFYHHDIFGNLLEGNHHQYVRITPTYHSTVFDHEVGIPQNQRPKSTKQRDTVNQTTDNNYHVYSNKSRQRKQAELYPCRPLTGKSINQKFRDEKQKISEQINHTDGRTSRMRKCVEQMSNPIFGGYLWNPCFKYQEKTQNQRPYSPQDYRYQTRKAKQEEQPKVQGQNYQQNKLKAQKQYKQTVLVNKSTNIQKEVPKKDQTNKPYPKKQSKQIKSKPNTKHLNNMKRFKSSCNLHCKPRPK